MGNCPKGHDIPTKCLQRCLLSIHPIRIIFFPCEENASWNHYFVEFTIRLEWLGIKSSIVPPRMAFKYQSLRNTERAGIFFGKALRYQVLGRQKELDQYFSQSVLQSPLEVSQEWEVAGL